MSFLQKEFVRFLLLGGCTTSVKGTTQRTPDITFFDFETVVKMAKICLDYWKEKDFTPNRFHGMVPDLFRRTELPVNSAFPEGVRRTRRFPEQIQGKVPQNLHSSRLTLRPSSPC
jgi:hypothetical protein